MSGTINGDVAYGQTTIPIGIRSRFVDNNNGITMHILEAGFEERGRPLVVLMHGESSDTDRSGRTLNIGDQCRTCGRNLFAAVVGRLIGRLERDAFCARLLCDCIGCAL